MKIKSLRIKTTLYSEYADGRMVNAEISSGFISIEGTKFLPDSSAFNNKQLIELVNYIYSPSFKFISDKRYNVSLEYKGSHSNQFTFCKLNWYQRQKLYLIMGDHIILNSGNFKWLVGTILTVIFFWYQAKQNDKLVQANKDISSLKDSLNKYQNLTKLK